MKFIEAATVYNQFAIIPSIGIVRRKKNDGQDLYS